jgi:AcrR family transcriptional regulator
MKHVQRRVSARRRATVAESPPRERVLKAAFALFRRHGFAGTSTLEIATRAQVSKRDLYALFPTKDAILAACIAERARRMRAPLDLAAAAPASRKAVAATLVELGSSVLRGVTHPDVLAVYRLAIAESDRAPEVARTLDRNGREANHASLAEYLKRAQAQGLVGAGDPVDMAARFFAVLWGGLLVQLLLRVREAPDAAEAAARARTAAAAIIGPL